MKYIRATLVSNFGNFYAVANRIALYQLFANAAQAVAASSTFSQIFR